MAEHGVEPPLLVVLFSSDIMLLSSVSGAVRAAGLAFFAGTDLTEVVEQLSRQSSMLCFDLGAPSGDPLQIAQLIPAVVLKRSIAFGPHVHTARLELAKQAGFGKVMSRGQFVAKMQHEFQTAAQS